MASKPVLNSLLKALPQSTLSTRSTSTAAKCLRLATSTSISTSRAFSVEATQRTHAFTAKRSQRRPTIDGVAQSTPLSRRTIFIQTETTPNNDALKFLPNHTILPPDIPSTFLEYLTPRSTLSAPHPSPLAAQLLNVDGITSVFYGKDYITVTKASDTPWAHVKPEVFSLITEAVTNGAPIVNTVAAKAGEESQGEMQDKPQFAEEDAEVVSMIEELLETRIRPAIQEDGGDIEFRGFQDGEVLLKLRGACRTCDSSTVTLKNGIESMLMHYIEEVKGVRQVLDREEEVAMEEFQKFEEKLKGKKGPGVMAEGALDKVEG